MSERPIGLRYNRVSSDEQAKGGLSLDMQDDATLRYVLGRAWLPGQLFTDVLQGTRDDRPGYQALLSEVRRLRTHGQPVTVTVWRLDRFGRRLVERARSWEEFTQLDVPIHSVMENGEVHRVLAKMLAVWAEEEVLQNGERIAGVFKRLKDQGWWSPAGTLPYGYRWRPRTEDERARGAPARVLDVEPIEAERLAEGYARLKSGASVGSVHHWLASLSEEERGGRAMHRRAVFLMFQSPLYMARFETGGPVGQWPALVDDASWHAAQRAFSPRGTTGREANVRYLLSGFLSCSVCGRPMIGMRAPATDKRRYAQSRYRCTASTYGEKCRASTTTEDVEDQVLDQVAALLDAFAEPEYRARLEQAWARERAPRVVSNTERTRRQLERTIARADQEIAQAVRLLADHRITQQAYDALYRDAVGKQDAARKRLADVAPAVQETELPPIADLLGPTTSWRAELARGEVEAQRRVLGLLVQRVVARRVGWGKYEVVIDWTPLGRRLMMPSPVGGEQVS